MRLDDALRDRQPDPHAARLGGDEGAEQLRGDVFGNAGAGIADLDRDGAWLGGRKTALIMENSGLRVAAEYIARISMQSGVPVLMLLSYRGDVGDTEHWSIPHGIVVEPLLDALRVKYLIVRNRSELRPAIKRAYRLSEAQLYPTAVLISGDCVWDD